MSAHILSTIVCVEFTKQFPKRNEFSGSRKAMLLSFGKLIDFKNEEGYRNLDLAIYAATNYVLVCKRERWDVVNIKEPGKDYSKGSTAWEKLTYHDSGWRTDGVNKFFFHHRNELNTIDHLFTGNWYQIVDADKHGISDMIEK